MEYGAKLKAGFMAVLMLTGWGCAAPAGHWQTVSPQPEVFKPTAFAHRMVSPDVEVYWNCSRPQPAHVRLEGIAKNAGTAEVHLLRLELYDVDRLTERILHSAAADADIILHPDEFSPFRLDLEPASAHGRVDLLSRYRITSVGILQTTRTDKTLSVHEMCSPGEHRNPGATR